MHQQMTKMAIHSRMEERALAGPGMYLSSFRRNMLM
jgi:hypothetical protein